MPVNFAFVSLKQHGYRAADDQAQRRLALETAFNHLSSKQKDEMVLHDLSRSLLNLARLHKNRNPHHSAVYTEDADWIKSLVSGQRPDKRSPHDRPGKRPRDDSDDDHDDNDRPGKRLRADNSVDDDEPYVNYDSDFWESKYNDQLDLDDMNDHMENEDEPNRGKKRRDVEDINDRMAQRPKFNPRQGQKRPLDETELEPIKRPRTGPHRPNKRALDETDRDEAEISKRPRTGPHRPDKRPHGLDDFIEGVDQASGKKQKFGQVEIESDEDLEEILAKKRNPDRSRPIFSVPVDNDNDNEMYVQYMKSQNSAEEL